MTVQDQDQDQDQDVVASNDDGDGDAEPLFALPARVADLDGLPDHVADWLVQAIDAMADRSGRPTRDRDDKGRWRRVVAARSHPLDGPTIVAGGPDPLDDPVAARAAAGQLIRVARGLQAWAESVELEGTRRLLAAVECDPGLDLGQRDPASSRTVRGGLARTAVATELQVLTGLPITQCRDRVALASATHERAGYLRARVASGTTTLFRACTTFNDTRHLDPLTADEVARAVLRPIDGVRTSATDPKAGGHRAFPRFQPPETAPPATAPPETGAHAPSAGADSAGADPSHADSPHADSPDPAGGDAVPDGNAVPDSDAAPDKDAAPEADAVPDGFASETAALVELGGVSQDTFRKRLARAVAAAAPPDEETERRRRQARAGRDLKLAPGDDGVSHLDLTAESDRVLAAHDRVDRLARRARQAGDHRTLAQLRADVTTDLLVHGTVPDDHLLGDAPPGRVQVVVSLSTLLGLDDQVAEAPGRGFLTAAQVRRVAVQAGSTLRRLVTDPVTGAVVEATRTYRPTQAMREYVIARDGTCRAPGCAIPAAGADLDHVREWDPAAALPADGATHPDNLTSLHRGHHNPKTRKWWSVMPGPGGELRWKTLTGQQISTRPANYGDLADTAPPGAQLSLLESGLARLLEGVLDPAPLRDDDVRLMHRTARAGADRTARAGRTARADADRATARRVQQRRPWRRRRRQGGAR